MKLTIGMSCYDDYDGVWFTIQSILMYHSECIDDINFIVIDGNSESNHGQHCEKLVSKLVNKHGNNGLYVKNISWPGTASRDYIFQYAKTPYVLCLDSHVQITPGSIKKLINFYDKNPNYPNLIQGQLLDDSGEVFATEMLPVWEYNMYGKWSINPKHLNAKKGYEVEIMGLGLFSCTKKNWLGFNNRFRGFGGEEGYIHKKYKRAGHKTIVQPWLKWNHRFHRPHGVPYHNEYIDRVKNYLIGWHELGESVDEIIDYYSSSNTTPGQERQGIKKSTLEGLYKTIANLNENEMAPSSYEEENRQLRARLIELEMRLMEMVFAPAQNIKEMELKEYSEKTTQRIKEIHSIEANFKEKLQQKPVPDTAPSPFGAQPIVDKN